MEQSTNRITDRSTDESTKRSKKRQNSYQKKIVINIGILFVLLCGVIFTVLYGTGVIGSHADMAEVSEDANGEEGNISAENQPIEGSLEQPYQIHSEEEFVKFAESVNTGNTYLGQHVELLADLDFAVMNNEIMNNEIMNNEITDKEITDNEIINNEIMTEEISVGTLETETPCNFQGTFNGNGHVISNVNIQKPEGEAGLFINLAGTVCNLTLKDGTIEGLISGGIASSVTETGAVVNCSSQMTVTGETAGGIAGKSLGTVENSIYYEKADSAPAIVGDSSAGVTAYCYRGTDGAFSLYNNYRGDETLPEESRPMIQVLNDRLDRMNHLYDTNGWNHWSMGEEDPVLIQEKANLMTEAGLVIRTSGSSRELKGYYSENEDAWCFAIPEGTEENQREITLTFSNGDTDILEGSADQTELAYEYDRIHYRFEFLKNDTLPSIFIDTNDENGDGLTYLNENKQNLLSGEATILNENGATVYTGIIERINGRGNDSWLQAPKKGYSLKLKVSADLLGMGADKDFALLSGYRDNSLMTYKIIQDMSKEMQLPYAPESRFVNLYIDGKYIGMYLLTEKMEIGNSRFSVSNLYKQTKKMNGDNLEGFQQEHWKSTETKAERVWYDIEKEPADYTGGYLLEVDRQDYDETQSRFISDRGTSITLKSNTYASENQVNYISDYWQDFEDAVFSEDGYNEKGKYYAEYIDMESFANQWAMYELTEDTSMMGSIYFYKDSDDFGDGRLHAAYLWDVEHSFVEEEHLAKSWIMGPRMRTDLAEGAGFWLALYQHDDFAQMVSQEWAHKILPTVQKLLNTEEIIEPDGLSSISGYERAYTYAGALNSTRWTNCNWWDKGERIRLFLTERMEFLNQTLSAYYLDYDYYELQDGVYYGYHYAKTEGGEDIGEPVVG